MRRPPAQIVAQDAIRRRRRIVRALERGTRFPPHPPPSRGGGGRAVPRRRGGARLLGPRRARFRRARAGNARAQEPPPPLREREALLGEADPVLLGCGGDGAALLFCAAAFAGRHGGEREALVAGAATAVAPIVFWQSQFLQVDALFSCLLMLSLVSVFFLEGEEGRGTRWLWVLRVLIALAVLTKGPLAIVIVGLVVLTRCATARSLRLLGRLQPLRSIFVFLLLVVPWYFFAARAGGPAYAYDLVVNQNWNRFFRAFDHIQPWWFYCESMWSDFFPWTALALAAPFVLARAGLLRERRPR